MDGRTDGRLDELMVRMDGRTDRYSGTDFNCTGWL